MKKISRFALGLMLLALVWGFLVVSAGTSAASQEPPTVLKNWVVVKASTINSYKGSYDTWSWLPRVNFRTTGALPSGAILSVEFTQPGGAPWVKLDCEASGNKFECGGPNDPTDRSIIATGVVSFVIKMRNELAGSEATLFTGKAKVEKVPSNDSGPKAAKEFVYLVNQDWNMPIGYVVVNSDDNFLNIAFWVRGDEGRTDPHLFYQGKEVGVIFEGDIQVAAPGCSPEIEIEPTISTAESVPQRGKWNRMLCEFKVIRGEDKGEGFGFGKPHYLKENPGEYEFKLLRNNKLARSIKFTVSPGGSFENGINAANKIGGRRVIVPVTIIGDQDGVWDRNAWKTEAFYGNPLTGFTPPQ